MSVKKLSGLCVALALVLAGCSDQLEDRGGTEGAPPDFIGDVDYVEVFRNADAFPNIARACVQGLGFATTSTGRGESSVGGPLVRVPEWDAFCASKRPPG
ncbi:hypothetical protein [Amycolatopsis sp. YIM 10]|uniref:hypothetical protein n=1 Tax=Amycolatopsis sp. YIM 10 TaxID=2653857 RepID=UPI0012907D15|nr:hypothetical protein [Amycolatopsis sp. YIM 10]QFU90333.1 hypothetical protein YIM_25790 [Amycolatopsis sp. YIM 10]